jgi:hypothetical protein
MHFSVTRNSLDGSLPETEQLALRKGESRAATIEAHQSLREGEEAKRPGMAPFSTLL